MKFAWIQLTVLTRGKGKHRNQENVINFTKLTTFFPTAGAISFLPQAPLKFDLLSMNVRTFDSYGERSVEMSFSLQPLFSRCYFLLKGRGVRF